MKVYLEVSLDAYWPALSQGLQHQIQREINGLLNEDKRIAIKTVPPSNGLHSENTSNRMRNWGSSGDSSEVANPYRTFGINDKKPQRGAIAKVMLELQKSGRTEIRVPALLELIGRLVPEREPKALINQLWATGYLENKGLSVPEDSVLKGKVL